MDDKKKNNKTYSKIKKYSESYFDDDSYDHYFADDIDASMLGFAAPILMMVMAPGFVILSARHNLGTGGTIFMFILFLLVCGIDFFIPFSRGEEKNAASKQISRTIFFKAVILTIWTFVFMLIPVITNAKLYDDKSASNAYISLYAIYMVLFTVDSFVSILLLGKKRIKPHLTSRIDLFYAIFETIVLWSYGAVISTLLFDEIIWIIVMNIIFFIAFAVFSFGNFILQLKKREEQISNRKIDSILINSKVVLILYLCISIFIIILWLIGYFTLLK